MRHHIFLVLLAGTLLSGSVCAQVPKLVNYQGRVAVDTVNFEGAGQFKFALVSSNGTTTFWSNDGTSAGGSEPTAAVTLVVAKGLYSVLLGDIALGNMTAIPATAFANPDVRLRVWFNDGVNGSQLLTPDQRLAPAAYLADGTVTSASIGTAAVTSGKIAAGAVSGTNIAPASLTSGSFAVPGAPVNGQVLGYNNGGLTWTAPGGGVFSLNGTSAYYNGGNVGIGSVAPVGKLEVVGQDALRLVGFQPYLTLLDSNTGYARSRVQGLGGGMNLETESFINGSNPSALLTLAPTGNVGIGGSPNPIAKLEVVGQDAVRLIGFQPFLTLLDSNAGYARSRIQAVNGGFVFEPESFLNGTNPAAAMAITLTGLVGIGTTTPIARLDVNGDISGTRLFLKADPSAPTNAAVLCQNAAVTNFIPYNTATNRPLNLIVRDASVRALTITGGADLAEPFPMSQERVPAGAVVSIDPQHPGKLRMSGRAYDRKVAGIVSGANGIKPGISMIDEEQLEPGENVALSGRVYVKANTSAGTIGPGDLLTTSDVPGEAMKAADHQRAQGSILGKAMTSLDEATGMVLVLVTLQ